MKSPQVFTIVLVLLCVLLDPGQVSFAGRDKIPIVYSNQYDYDLFDFETHDHFTSKKYSQIVKNLVASNYFKPDAWQTPDKTNWQTLENDLKTVHSARYLSSINAFDPFAILKDVFDFSKEERTPSQEARLKQLSTQIAQGIVSAQYMGTGGTLKALELALTHPEHWAINLSGGYHHAGKASASGYCVVADAAAAIKSFLAQNKHQKVLIVDLDAHFGDGNAPIFASERRVKIFDIYNEDIFPVWQLKKDNLKRKVDFDFPIESDTRGSLYLQTLKSELPSIIAKGGFSLIYYNAGTDVYEHDPLGSLSLSEQDIIERDEFVFRQARKARIPIFMALSGGYHEDMPDIVANSIVNLISKGVILTDSKPSERSQRKR